ncbi:MAG: hypothetical protein WC878_02760 [Candidatus Paceibacterota bacterium]|jgi:uncharacterized membrane protein YagU involved in acid resistance
MRQFIKFHLLAIIFAVIIGMAVVAPTISSVFRIGFEDFRGVFPIWNDDEQHYLVRARDIVDGNNFLGNAYLAEHKKDVFIQPPIAEQILVFPAQIFPISVPALFVAYDFIFPFASVFLLYFLFLAVIPSRFASAFASFLFHLFFLNSFNRPVNPQFNFLFLIIGLLLIANLSGLSSDEKMKKAPLLHFVFGIVFAVSFFISPYVWTSLAVLYGLTLCGIFISKKASLSSLRENFFYFLVPALIGIIPYAFFLRNASSGAYYAESLRRFGLISNHFPACFANVGIVFLAMIGLFLVRRKIENKNTFYFSFSLLLSAVIFNWQNVFTGTYLQFSSHYYLFTVLFVAVSLAPAMRVIFRNFDKRKDFAAFLMILTVFSAVLYKQIGDMKKGLIAMGGVSSGQMQEIEKDRAVFDWFNKNTAKESVVYVIGERQGELLPVYTANNVYFNYYAGFYAVSNREMKERWLRQNIFYSPFNQEFIRNSQSVFMGSTYVDSYQNWKVRQKLKGYFGMPTEKKEQVPNEVINDVVLSYRSLQKEDPFTAIKKYRVDYFLVNISDDNGKRANEYLSKNKNVSKSARIDNFVIFRVQ